MRFFSKIVFICNICFLISLLMRYIEIHRTASHDAVIALPWVEATVVVLGFIVAILLNAAFVFIVLYRKSIRKHVPVPLFIIIFNMLLLPVEIWQQFFMRS